MSRLPPNPALRQLEVLVGDWEVDVPQFPGQRGQATFEWLEDGAYLCVHSDAPDPAPGVLHQSSTGRTFALRNGAVSRTCGLINRPSRITKG